MRTDSPRPTRAERHRARQVRRRRLRRLRLAGVITVTALCMATAAGIVTMHIGVRPVLTGSMQPDYGPGALLVTRQVQTSSLRPGMIVLIVPPGEHAPYAHRVATITGTAKAPVITTKGDANRTVDPWHAKIIAPNVSVVIGSVPGIGSLLVDIHGSGQIILAMLGGLLVAWAGVRWALGAPAGPSVRRSVGPSEPRSHAGGT